MVVEGESEELSPSKDELLALFEQLVNSLPQGCASISVNPLTGGMDFALDLVPGNPNAAAIGAAIHEGAVIYLYFGHGAVFEVPDTGRRYTSFPCLDEVRALCSAVMAGKFEEVVTFVDSRVVGARAKIDLGGEVAVEAWRELAFSPFRKEKKEYFKYSPYC